MKHKNEEVGAKQYKKIDREIRKKMRHGKEDWIEDPVQRGGKQHEKK